ncbi:MAG: c-type cytochrome [Polaromonas sp.]
MAMNAWQSVRVVAWAWAMTVAAVPALAQTPVPVPAGAQLLALKSLAATCANCHGTDGRAAAGSSVTSLAGLDRAYLVKQMTDFQSGARPATVMHQISKGYSRDQIDALAGYFAGLAK